MIVGNSEAVAEDAKPVCASARTGFRKFQRVSKPKRMADTGRNDPVSKGL
jgi:hypothetical protein